MTSQIDPTQPPPGEATTAAVRDNFDHAKNEIEALQADTTQNAEDTATAQTTADAALANAALAQAAADAAVHEDHNDWTPEININGVNTGITYATRTAHYVNLGPVTFISIQILLSSKGAQAGAVTIPNLPVVSKTTPPANNSIPCRFANMNAATPLPIYAHLPQFSQAIAFLKNNAGALTALLDTDLQNNSSILVTGFYFN